MSSTFTPSDAVDMAKEKDWSINLGMMDWDSTSIVFTKRSLIEFLKYAGTTVDPNFTNIQKLPKYAKFGKLSAASTDGVEQGSVAPQVAGASSPVAVATSGFVPTRRVREAPGGAHTDIFATDDDDALATAPPRNGTTQTPAVSPVLPAEAKAEEPRSRSSTTSSISNLWDVQSEPSQFKPSRRVREAPGGKDSISSLFSD